MCILLCLLVECLNTVVQNEIRAQFNKNSFCIRTENSKKKINKKNPSLLIQMGLPSSFEAIPGLICSKCAVGLQWVVTFNRLIFLLGRKTHSKSSILQTLSNKSGGDL